MEVEVLDLQLLTDSTKSGPHGFPVMREYTPDTARDNFLLEQNGPIVKACEVQERHFLVIAIFAARVLPISHRNEFSLQIDIRPLDPAQLIL